VQLNAIQEMNGHTLATPFAVFTVTEAYSRELKERLNIIS
jgi:hypothetical protein